MSDLKFDASSLSLTSWPASAEGWQEEREVLQFIDGQFHRWVEYRQSTDGPRAIRLVKPAAKNLTETESRDLLRRSAKWREAFQHIDIVESAEVADPQSARSFDGEEARKVIVGADDRRPVADPTASPYNTVSYLVFQFPSLGWFRATGLVVAPYCVLTSGHTIYEPLTAEYVDTFWAVPAQMASDTGKVIYPFGFRKCVDWEVDPNYVTTGASSADLGAAFFDAALEGIDTYLPVVFNYRPERVRIVGFPSLVQGEGSFEMWEAEGQVTEFVEGRLRYDVDTSGGNSGSPIWAVSDGELVMIGVHGSSGETDNAGVLFGKEHIAMIERWMTKQPPLPPQIAVDSVREEGSSLMIDVEFHRESVWVSGRAWDLDGQIASIKYQWNGGDWRTAEGRGLWSIHLDNVNKGNNTLKVAAVDSSGMESKVATVKVYRGSPGWNERKVLGPLLGTVATAADLKYDLNTDGLIGSADLINARALDAAEAQ
ncbi:MAG: trypsin-like peptidase domain-containing protein [Sumerlaeia bacterium]